MKRFLDTSILVEACLESSPHFDQADRLIRDRGACTSAHALAECYATLSGDPRLRCKPADAALMVEGIAEQLKVLETGSNIYRRVISNAASSGVRGGMVYDALHAETAREAGCEVIHTLNVRHFKMVARDMEILGLRQESK